MKGKYLVTKSNNLIEARYKLTTNEQKLILSLISKIEPEDEDFKTYRMKISDFMKLLAIENKGTYKDVQKITYGLMEKVLQIKESDGLLQINWFSSVKYYDGKGYVDLCFDPKLKPYLLGLKECFVRYNLNNIVQLKSSYAIRLYEMLKQYQRIGKRIFSLEMLKKILGLTSTEYPLYANFKQKILKVAQNELKNNSDISFDFKEIKRGRKITDIEFIIISNQTNENAIVEVEAIKIDIIENGLAQLGDYEKDLFDKLQKYYQLSREQAYEIISVILPQQGREYIEELLVYCKNYYERKTKTGSDGQIGAITSKAFREGWQPQGSLFDIERKQKDEEIKRKQEELKKQEEVAKEEEDKLHQAAEIFIDSQLSDEETLTEFPIYLESKYNYFFKDRYKPDMKAEELKKGKLRLFLNHYVREKYFNNDSK